MRIFKKQININKAQIVGIVIALSVIILSVIFIKNSDLVYFLMGISLIIGGIPFFISLIMESNQTRQKDEMFLEFSRNLVESVKAGTPISKSILNVRGKDYGALNPYINKLANQIAIGIPLQAAFDTFARDVNSETVTRAVGIISESEKAGGEIEEVLESVAISVSQVEKLRKERRAAMYTLVVQGYIIFFIFIVIMLIMQFKILPIAAGLGENIGGSSSESASSSLGGMGFSGMFGGGEKATCEELARPFIWLLIVQGFFVGLVIGKLSEGKIKYGLKHSFILLAIALLIYTGANVILPKC
jgi:flagellar protein FlaJ